MNRELAILDGQTAVDTYRMSTDAATMCKGIVLASAQNIQGKKYVKVEGWQAIAIAHGCTASARDVEKTDTGIRAIGEVRRMSDGALISQAEGFVGDDEKTWSVRPEYARRAMAQTRAISRACRSAFAHVVVMMNAGLSTTPAEEVPQEGFTDHAPEQGKPPVSMPQAKPYPKPTESPADNPATGTETPVYGNSEPEQGPPATEPQVKAIHAILGKLGVKDELAKHEHVAKVLGLSIVPTTFKDLSKAQASRAIDLLGKEQNANA